MSTPSQSSAAQLVPDAAPVVETESVVPTAAQVDDHARTELLEEPSEPLPTHSGVVSEPSSVPVVSPVRTPTRCYPHQQRRPTVRYTYC